MTRNILRLEWDAAIFRSRLKQRSVSCAGAMFLSLLLFIAMQGDDLVSSYFYVSTKPVEALSVCPVGWVCPAKPLFWSKIGAWYEPWWEAHGPAAAHWTSWSRFRPC